MGTGYASGEGRAMNAVKMALQSPLLDNNDIFGTKSILLNIISGTQEITIGEIGEIIEFLQKEAGQEADIIWGNGYDESIGEKISVTILCTGFKNAPNIKQQRDLSEEHFKHLEETHKEKEEAEKTGEAVKEEEIKVYELDVEPAKPAKSLSFWADQEPEAPRAPQKRTPPAKSRSSKAAKSGGDSLDNWFYRKFGGLFEDDDQAV
jgi:cell division protein FtsZ